MYERTLLYLIQLYTWSAAFYLNLPKLLKQV